MATQGPMAVAYFLFLEESHYSHISAAVVLAAPDWSYTTNELSRRIILLLALS